MAQNIDSSGKNRVNVCHHLMSDLCRCNIKERFISEGTVVPHICHLSQTQAAKF